MNPGCSLIAVTAQSLTLYATITLCNTGKSTSLNILFQFRMFLGFNLGWGGGGRRKKKNPKKHLFHLFDKGVNKQKHLWKKWKHRLLTFHHSYTQLMKTRLFSTLPFLQDNPQVPSLAFMLERYRQGMVLPLSSSRMSRESRCNGLLNAHRYTAFIPKRKNLW